MASASSKKKNYKGRSPNVLRFIDSCGSEAEIGTLMPANLAAGARLAAENQSQSADEKTASTYEFRLIALEKFAGENGDDAVLFGPNKRPFLAATIQTFIQLMGETKGKRLGTLRCRGRKPLVLRGHAAAFKYWFDAFGHSGPYSQDIQEIGGVQKVIPKGNPMESPDVKKTMKQLIKRAARPTRSDTQSSRVPYEPKKAPPFSLQQLLRIHSYCLKTII